jgi:hypothetical protein
MSGVQLVTNIVYDGSVVSTDYRLRGSSLLQRVQMFLSTQSDIWQYRRVLLFS